MPSNKHEQLLVKWLDKKLNNAEQQEFEALYVQEPEFTSLVDTANRVSFEAEQNVEEMPQPWNKQQTMPFSHAPRNTQWTWMPVASMAMSLFAIVLVFSGFQVESQKGELKMGFNLTPNSAQMAALLDKKINQYQSENQALMAQYIDALHEQQLDSQAQLSRFLLDTNREERREDFAELIRFINEQRDDDQRFYARQLNNLEAELLSASIQE